MSHDGSMVLVGYSSRDLGASNTGSSDCVAIKLNAGGTMAWARQVNWNVDTWAPAM